MKAVLSAGLLLLLAMAAGFTAGCTESVPPDPSGTIPAVTPAMTQGTVTHGGDPTFMAAVTPTVTATETPARIFTGDYHWAEYRDNVSVTMPPNPRSSWVYRVRIEKSMGKYRDSPAVHYRSTSITDYAECCINNVPSVTKDGWIAVTDMYYNPSMDAFLGGTLTEKIKGKEQPAEDLAPAYYDHHQEDKPSGDMGITPFGEMNVPLESMGRESVTVPAGTFPDARKYTGKFHDGTPITFWVVSGIPVPVQFQYPDKYLDGIDPVQTFELKGWG